MPRMNGFEVLEWARQDDQCRRLVVHVLTASPREADVQRAYELGANSYVIKPSRVDELVALVKALHQWHHFTALPQKPASYENERVATQGRSCAERSGARDLIHE
jgi:DNA-binding response OmpR family regulator